MRSYLRCLLPQQRAKDSLAPMEFRAILRKSYFEKVRTQDHNSGVSCVCFLNICDLYPKCFKNVYQRGKKIKLKQGENKIAKKCPPSFCFLSVQATVPSQHKGTYEPSYKFSQAQLAVL